MNTLPTLESPCIGVCELDLETDCCKGCFRSREEVAAWHSADDAAKRAILEQARARHNTMTQGQNP